MIKADAALAATLPVFNVERSRRPPTLGSVHPCLLSVQDESGPSFMELSCKGLRIESMGRVANG